MGKQSWTSVKAKLSRIPPEQLEPKDIVGKLVLYYVESGIEFTNEYGDIDERFYSSLESAFTQFFDVCKEKPNLGMPFVSRLQDLKKNTKNIG